MPNLDDLIAEAREFLRSENAQYYDSSLIGELIDALEAATSERDAVLAAIERIRQAVAGHPECDRYEEGDVISCGWKSAYASVVAALDGAPEPEAEAWEYGFHFLGDDGIVYKTRGGWDTPERAQALGDEWIVDERESHMLNDQPDIHVALIRRRKAGPWLPIEGESK